MMRLPLIPFRLSWKLIRVIDGETFYRICYALLFFAGVKLIYDGLLGKGLI